ncbi:MAG TPA: hypothetical protein VLD63_13415 [Anaerolineales bacterium]|nr:hypothetical protein [Anaerolineales bacterium]
MVEASAALRLPARHGLGLDVLATATRLVILVPEAGVDPTEMAEQVRRLDPEGRLAIMYVGLATASEADELWLRRELVTMGSLTRDGRPSVELRVEEGKDWIAALAPVYRAGDALVCLRAHDPWMRWRRRPRLAEALARAFDATVVELDGLHLGGRPSRLSSIRSLLGTVPFLIVAGFLALQVPLERQQTGPAWQHQVLQVILLVVEISLIWLWETRVM